MNVRNCAKCGKIYAYDGFSLCPRCRRQEEEDFKKVKEYLYDNPGADIKEVSQETGVSTKKILRYLREGKLELKDESNFILDCERCGTPIKTGRYCDKCATELQKELKNAVSIPKKEDTRYTGKMYVANRHNRKK
ncbi:TIGR03826 family flagellar region protein [Thermohalobacter berrensis]|uniref:MerR family transcriptional regulator n=1 Tax=Thermohalobacter berrensis TaxID=99594 RepID=A0A419T4F6_9FIRM|nr:TIGR03826 family flagellar region protein [Thermohalobacter berrensis]RKD32325.1 MerR family transcriptional regulator [Thermohalobacter berrensis]